MQKEEATLASKKAPLVDQKSVSAQKALAEFYRNTQGEEVFIPDWQGGGEWVSVEGGKGASGGLGVGEIQEILRLFSEGRDFKPRTRGESALAAVTCYWKIGSNTDHWTRRGESSTGVPLRQGVVAVDPAVIPYGSLVLIEGVAGAFVAADCGSHVQKRVAVMKTARTAKEKEAIVIDVYFVQEKEGRAFDASLPKFVKIHYFMPSSRNT
ncbi:MAG: 3D domain-containing protein [Verrucomicrobiota bacterium]